MKTEFDADYYENGLVTGQSCYMNYRWMPELTIKMAHHIARHIGLQETDKILDFGCAKGYLVKAFKILDFDAYGCDISQYAIDQVDADVRKYCVLIESEDCFLPFDHGLDWIMSKDVLEHLSESQIDVFLEQARSKCKRMFHVVPMGENDKFVVPEYELDKTHKLAKSKEWWVEKFRNFGWNVVRFDYNIRGVKENWTTKHPFGNGFFILEANR